MSKIKLLEHQEVIFKQSENLKKMAYFLDM